MSNLDSPVSSSDDDASRPNAIQESRWNDLLGQRPTSDKGAAAATKWLVQVLETSCTTQQQISRSDGGDDDDGGDNDDDDEEEEEEDEASVDAVKPKEESAFTL
jgi:hypothetical protein